MRCPSCGHDNPVGQRFCGECGTPSPPSAARAAPRIHRGNGSAASAVRRQPRGGCRDPERRGARAVDHRTPLVSVLFADLVGFTTLSEARDPEEVRELLSRYFDESRRIVERYGGVVEKFIGDAVMALWGSPIAHEDDAERASARRGADRPRAWPRGRGWGTGPARQGRRPDRRGRGGPRRRGSGDGGGHLVNTASRIQSVATPGSVFVGESTMRTTDQAISYESAARSS